MANRNDMTNAVILTEHLGKWVCFISKNHPEGIEPTTLFLAYAANKTALYENEIVAQNNNRIMAMDAEGTNTDAETLIIHHINRGEDITPDDGLGGTIN